MRGENKDEREDEGMKNGIAKLLKIIAIITLVAGIVLTIWGLTDMDYYVAIFAVGIGGLITAAFIRGFAEVIELLQRIKDNTERKEESERTLHSTGQPVEDSIKPASHEPIKNDYPDVRTKKDSPKRETELPPIIASPAQREEWDVWICKKCGKVHKSYVIKCPCGGTKEESK